MDTIIRPLRTERDYERALAEVERLMDAEAGSKEEESLEVLAILVSDYERRHYPIPPPDPIDYLVHIMEAKGLTRRDLEPMIGSRGRVTEILNRKRPLTLPMMRRLADALDLSTDVLMQPYEVIPSGPGSSVRPSRRRRTTAA